MLSNNGRHVFSLERKNASMALELFKETPSKSPVTSKYCCMGLEELSLVSAHGKTSNSDKFIVVILRRFFRWNLVSPANLNLVIKTENLRSDCVLDV